MRVALIACHLLVAAAFAPPLTPLPRLAVPRSSRPLGVPMRMADSGKRTWDAASCLRDHRDVLLSLPRIAGAYVGPAAVDPAVSESVMCVVNSVDPCPYCTGLHGELARMAGVEDPAGLQASTGEEIVAKQEPAVVFARSFAEQNGRGARVDKAFAELSAATRPAYALSVQALCWFLLWGKTGGNTINAAIARLRGASPAPNRPPLFFGLAFLLYYGPLYLLITAVNSVLRFAPQVPKWFSAAFGMALTLIAGTWIMLPGLAGVVAGAAPQPAPKDA